MESLQNVPSLWVVIVRVHHASLFKFSHVTLFIRFQAYFLLEKLPPTLPRWMGEFVSNIYESTRQNNDMYIIWALDRAPRDPAGPGLTFVNDCAGGRQL